MITATQNFVSIGEALETVRSNVPERRREELPLAQALGGVLTENVTCPEPSPRYTNSAMDGFATRWADVDGACEAKPAVLQVVGESRAGVPFQGVMQSGQAVRISTGAMMPEGADTVVPVEDTSGGETSVSVSSVRAPRQHVRFQGEEFKAGEFSLERGTMLQPSHIALLASVGVATVPVFARPRVSILVTGTELVAHDAEAEPWQIRDSNGPMLASAITSSGGAPIPMKRVEDTLAAVTESISAAAGLSDIVLVSGGVSVGPHDHVKEAAGAAGFVPLLWKVRQKPGKPLFIAKTDGALLFGLPGNPVSAFMCYSYYVHPTLMTLRGRGFSGRTRQGRLAERTDNAGSRGQFLLVALGESDDSLPAVQVLDRQSSYMLTTLAGADGFVLVDAGESREKDDPVDVHLFPWTV